MNITRRQALIAGSTLAGASMLPGQLRAETKQVSLAFGPVSPVYAIGMIAELKGYFRDEGLDSKLVTGHTKFRLFIPFHHHSRTFSYSSSRLRSTLQCPGRRRRWVFIHLPAPFHNSTPFPILSTFFNITVNGASSW